MTKSIEFKVPVNNKVTRQARGVPVWFTIGDRRVKFILQYNCEGKATWLTHYASGCKIGTLDDIAVELMCKYTPYHRFSKKQLAEGLINKIVTRLGAEKVLEKIDSVPEINK